MGTKELSYTKEQIDTAVGNVVSTGVVKSLVIRDGTLYATVTNDNAEYSIGSVAGSGGSGKYVADIVDGTFEDAANGYSFRGPYIVYSDESKKQISGGPYVLSVNFDGKSYKTSDNVTHQSCLREDTLITMADWSKKPIKDVLPGEMVKSYDFYNDCFIDVKCYGAYTTTPTKEWRRFVFETGQYLDIHDTHQVFTIAGYTLQTSKTWKTGMQGFVIRPDSTDGKPSGTHYADTSVWTVDDFESAYSLGTENSLYFANDILVGCNPPGRYQRTLSNCNREVSETEVNRFKHIRDYYTESRNKENKNAQFIAESAPARYLHGIRCRQLDTSKKRLSDIDYKSIKRAQGALTEEEWTATKDECTKLRADVNLREKQKLELEGDIENIRIKHGIDKIPTWRELFHYSYKTDMEAIFNERGMTVDTTMIPALKETK